jgi:rhamnosyltransferase subunit B
MADPHPHLVLACVGTTGDVHPFLRIAKTWQATGRRVTFITNSYHAPLLKDSGLAFVGVGTDEDYLRVLRNPDVWDPRKGFSALLVDYAAQIQQLDAAIRSAAGAGPAVAVVHPIVVPAAALSREQGAIQSVVSMFLAPSTLRSCHDPMRIGDVNVPSWVPMSWRRALWRWVEETWIDPAGMVRVNQAREALGLPVVQSTFLAYLENTPDLTVTLFPSWFGPVMPDWPQPMVSGDFQLFDAVSDDGLPAALSAFLTAGDRPLVFTPGTGNLHAKAFFSAALVAVTRLGRRAIFLTREQAQVPANLPASVLWQPYVPLSALLSHAGVLVHHGGIGTTAEALRAGTPQLVVPMGWDQFDNGARVVGLGVGRMIHASKLQARRLTHALRAILASDAVRASCAQVAARFTPAHDPAALCREIERRLAGSANLP